MKNYDEEMRISTDTTTVKILLQAVWLAVLRILFATSCITIRRNGIFYAWSYGFNQALSLVFKTSTTEVFYRFYRFAKLFFMIAKWKKTFDNCEKQFANCSSSPSKKISWPTKIGQTVRQLAFTRLQRLVC